MTSKPDYLTLLHEESRDLADLLDTLTEEQWDAPSLCEGWRVRDVVSHMASGHTESLGTIVVGVARERFNIARASRLGAIEYADSHSTAEIAAAFRRGTSGKMTGIARVIPKSEGFVDHLIHHQDIRRPLGLPREIPRERLVAALDRLPKIGSVLGAKSRAAGLRFVATDIAHAVGEGPVVEGAAEAIVMALGGRQVALDELSGEGLPTLVGRVKS